MPCRAWLPDEALRGGTLERVIAEAVLRWSEKWFARRLVGGLDTPARIEAATFAGEEDGDCFVHADGLAVGVDAKARRAIAGLMLDAEVPATLTPADGAALDALAAGCTEDFGRELGRAFRIGDESGWRRGLARALPFADGETFGIGRLEGRPLIRLSVEAGLAVELVKARAPVAPPPPPLRPVSEALARQPVRVAALLGRCELSLAELSGLAAGDVVVLDRPLDAPLDLTLAGSPSGARCEIDGAGDGLALKLLTPLTG